MPSPIPAITIIKTAMRLIGVIATGETPSADEATDGLQALNDVLERWSVEPYAVYGSLVETFETVRGQAIYTVGPGGDFDTDRPTTITGVYTNFDGVDFTAEEWTLDQYNMVPLKTQQTGYPSRYVYVNDAPLGQLILWPTPYQATPVSINRQQLLTQIPSIATIISLPPGYVSALQYAVAAELAPQYGSPRDMTAQARGSLAIIKRMNRQSPIAQFDSTLLGGIGELGIGIGAFVGGAVPDQWESEEW